MNMKMHDQDYCPLCSKSDLQVFREVSDWRGSQETFTIRQCTNCHFLITTPRPVNEELGRYYPSEDYVSHTDKPKGLFDKVYFAVQQKNLKDKHQKISKFITQGQLLDYGCGAGSFMQFMKQNSWEVEGVELSEQAAAIASKRVGAKVLSPLNYEKKEASFDLITLWHVLEHLPEIEDRLVDFYRWLKPGGYLFLALPNHRSLDARHFGSHWAAWDVPIHLWHFNQESMKQLAKRMEMEWVDTFPMPFDAYYVSMISAKNKGQTFWPLSGLWRGWRSNVQAQRTGEASSLIYVLKKA